MLVSSAARTKIVCTLGPSSSSPDRIRALIDAGMNVARINFSHGTHEQHASVIAAVRAAAESSGRSIAILGDLQGPRIRLGTLSAPRELTSGEVLSLAPEHLAIDADVPVTHEPLADDVAPGSRILINDGLIELVVDRVEGRRVHATVVHGGTLTSHKGLNLPGAHVTAPSITPKDEADIAFAIAHDLDLLALSFVRTSVDVVDLRRRLPRGIHIVAKIEKDTALAHLDAIVEAADAVMVARGDLGVELPFEEVPGAQTAIIAAANRLGRPVITATQMLESMIVHPRPTRAEASDVSAALREGTDAVMLSAETASGQHPVLAVTAMRRICAAVEARAMREATRVVAQPAAHVKTEDAIAAATAAAARTLDAPCVIVLTKRGLTARVVAAHRPGVPILALTDDARTYRQLALVWGVHPVLVSPGGKHADMVAQGLELARSRGLAAPGDRVVMTAGVPYGVAGHTNMLTVETV